MAAQNRSSPVYRRSNHNAHTQEGKTTSATVLDSLNGSSPVVVEANYGGNDVNDDKSQATKYRKRRSIKRRRRTRNAVILLLIALSCLVLTYALLKKSQNHHRAVAESASTDDDDGEGDDGGIEEEEEEGKDDDNGEAEEGDDYWQNPQGQGHHHQQQQQQRHLYDQPRNGRERGGRVTPTAKTHGNMRLPRQVAENGRDDDESTEVDDDRLAAAAAAGAMGRGHQQYMAGLGHERNRGDNGNGGGRHGHGYGPGQETGDYQQSPGLAAMDKALRELEEKIRSNHEGDIRWVDPELVPGGAKLKFTRKDTNASARARNQRFFRTTRRHGAKLAWETDPKDVGNKNLITRSDYIDYVQHPYEYRPKLMEPPANLGDYPKLRSLKEIMEIWPQDELDNPPNPIMEDLIHFDYNLPADLEAAAKFRDAKLPFKLINVPEVVAAGKKWTDEYVIENFDGGLDNSADGSCQESHDNFFAFFTPPMWSVEHMGIPPTRTNDWSFEQWARHAHYADRVGLSSHQPHFYFQAGVGKEERYEDEEDWTFISRDLPSFSSTEANFFQFEPESQKGIQCRFGERGVTAATHFDSGRNMVAMMTGAKRYILSPPRECSKLGIVTNEGNAIYRHSMLNFGHMNHMDRKDMPTPERQWLERAATGEAISTVLKAGEVLYIPSHWFHYITSLQKSAQCNVRSGVDTDGDKVFGGAADVTFKCDALFEKEEE